MSYVFLGLFNIEEMQTYGYRLQTLKTTKNVLKIGPEFTNTFFSLIEERFLGNILLFLGDPVVGLWYLI